MRITIVVTHLLGTGHLARALTLGRAFVSAGDSVTIISGGTAVPHFDTSGMAFVQLPPLRSNGTDFSNLLAEDGTPADAAYLSARQATLIEQALGSRPDVLVTELFPFGRRSLKREFQALLDSASAMPSSPTILSSIRDILAPPSKSSKITFADALVDQHYDGVLVHSDPDVVPLDISWPVSDALRSKLHYTGFVAPPPPAMGHARNDTVLVSAGGGSVGDAVFEAACAAAALDTDRPWRLLVSGGVERRDRMAGLAPANALVEEPRPDFRALLAGAHASISMCGYNTALDILQTGIRSIFVPFDDGGEVEQGLRARALDALPGITVLQQANLSGPALLAALTALAQDPDRAPRLSGMGGANRTVDIVHNLRNGRGHAT